MPMNWFRCYCETISDRKLRRLPPAQRWLWVAMLTLARQSPIPGRLLLSEQVPVSEEDLADAAAVDAEDIKAGLDAFIAQDMIHMDGAVIVVTHWNKRQFASDDVTSRVQDHRERSKAQDVERFSNVSETHQKQKQKTEADTDPEADAIVLENLTKQETEIAVDAVPATTTAVQAKAETDFLGDDENKNDKAKRILAQLKRDYPVKWVSAVFSLARQRNGTVSRLYRFELAILADWKAKGYGPDDDPRDLEARERAAARAHSPPGQPSPNGRQQQGVTRGIAQGNTRKAHDYSAYDDA